jgi:type IV secretory pathway TraG/TraD family ATPase VirD4
MSRADTHSQERRTFYLYLDEFQTFTGKAGNSYVNILSRARKYKFGVILAHQQTGQIDQELLKNILGNVSTILTFSVSAEDARRMAREYEVGPAHCAAASGF